MEQEQVNFGAMEFAPWQSSSAFNTYWQYSFVNRATYYANIRGEYQNYMRRFVQNYLWWYDGWVPYFHKQESGIFSTRIGTALVNGAARKVVGGRIYYKNKNKEKAVKGEDGKYVINAALAYIASDWSDRVGFAREIKKAITFAAAAGTSLIKLNREGGILVPKALRFDSFYPTVGFNGKLIDLVCFVRDFTQIETQAKGSRFKNYFIIEHRYFGEYKQADGKILDHAPLVSYEIRVSEGTVTNGMDYDVENAHGINFADLPRALRRDIAKAYDGIVFNSPVLLPFTDSLGAELVNWTDCVSALPELPFGESLLTNIMPFLQSYDYYFSAFNTDMYIGRGNVLLPKAMQGAKSGGYYSGQPSLYFTRYEGNPNSENDKPLPVQFDLRSSSWTEIRTHIIQDIAINTGMNLATIASFLNDNTAARTAREISTEESETALFVEDKREILEKPINRILKLVTLYNGYADDVVVRWSEAGLTNIYARTEMLATAVEHHLISQQTAASMFKQDDDEYQQAEEWDKIQSDKAEGSTFETEQDYERYLSGYSKQTAEPSGDSARGSGSEDTGNR